MNKILILSIFLFSHCASNSPNSIIIKANNDTVLSGNLYQAELYVPYIKTVLPAFYIIIGEDTIGLEIDTIKKCAVYKSIYKTEGEKVINGFVKYVDLTGKQNLETFSIKYYVKSR